MEDFEKIFDPNNYTEKAMPLVTALGILLNEAYFNVVSDDVRNCMNKYADLNDSFFNSLDDEQQKMYQKLGYVNGEESVIETLEHFNRGFRLGVMLMAEVLTHPERHE